MRDRAKEKQRGQSRSLGEEYLSKGGGGGEGRNGRSALSSESGRVICEDAAGARNHVGSATPEGARGTHGPGRCRERDRQILIVIMGSDVPRSWHVYASRFEAALATNRG